MAIIEVRGGNDRPALIKRFMGKSKEQAVSELVDHLRCGIRREELLEEKLQIAAQRIQDLLAMAHVISSGFSKEADAERFGQLVARCQTWTDQHADEQEAQDGSQ